MSAQPVGKRTGRVWWHMYSSVSTVSSVRKYIKKSRILNPIQSYWGIHSGSSTDSSIVKYVLICSVSQAKLVPVSESLVLSIIILIDIIPIHSMFKCSRTVRSARCKRNSHCRWTSEKIFTIYSSPSPIRHSDWSLLEPNLTWDWRKVTVLLRVQRMFL